LALTDDAITGIKRMILSGQVGPGEKLPREKELATRLGLWRSSLREAAAGRRYESSLLRTGAMVPRIPTADRLGRV
jgi:DNA-binding transcriptional MocR family regulator